VKKEFLDKGHDQLKAAGPTPVELLCSEESVANAIQELFDDNNITIIVKYVA
jgi:hypothetical protein